MFSVLLLKLAIGLLVALTLGQTFLVVRYCRFLGRVRDDSGPSQFQPNAVVILCARGNDPHLAECLKGLSKQKYANYSVVCVVDHPSDPAVPVIQNRIEQSPGNRFRLLVVDSHSIECSLKCNSLVHAIRSLGPDIEVVALIDADVVPDEQWLVDLVGPLAQPQVGAASGNRWFEPTDGRLGSQCRYLWNAAAIVQMHAYRIAWGGSLAFKRTVLDKTGMLDRWSRSLFEDTMVADVLKTHGLVVQTVDRLLVTSRESTSVWGMSKWIQRQLLDTRLYHSYWPLVAAHGIASTLGIAAVVCLCLWLLVSGAFFATGWGVVAIVSFLVANLGLVYFIDRSATRVVQLRKGPSATMPGVPWGAIFKSMGLTQLLHFLAVAKVPTIRNVTWRQVDYSIRDRDQIRMDRYCPMAEEQRNQSESI